MGEKTLNPIDPVAVLLVSKGSRGDKLLFRYPVDDGTIDEAQAALLSSNRGAVVDETLLQANASSSAVSAGNAPNHVVLTVSKKNASHPLPQPQQQQQHRFHANSLSSSSTTMPYNQNPYTLPAMGEEPPPQTSTTRSAKVPNTCLGPDGSLVGISDRILGNLLAVKQELCGGKFELKVNDVVFVGHPKLLVDHSAGSTGVSTTSGANVTAPVAASQTLTGEAASAGIETAAAPATTTTAPASAKKSQKEVSTLTLFNVVFVSV